MSKKKPKFKVLVPEDVAVFEGDNFVAALDTFLYHYLDGDEVTLWAREAKA